jgi:hypothetical protein
MKHILMKNTAIFVSIVSLVASLFASDVKAQGVSQLTRGNPKQSVENYELGPCRFEIAKMFDGYLIAYSNTRPPRATYYVPVTAPQRSSVLYDGFSLDCRENTAEQLSTALNAKYASGQWLNSGPAYGPEFVPFDRQAHVQTIPLKGTNWTGMAYTADDTTGDERTRARRFHFCLIHNTYALCGGTPVMWLENPKVNDLWKIKVILQSVRFTDKASAVMAASATTPE